MKKNIVKNVLLTTMLASLLAGCGETKTSQSDVQKESSSTVVEESPSEVEEESSVVEESPSEKEESSSAEPVEEKLNARVTLSRRIYLRSELNERLAANKTAIELDSFEGWSKALKAFKPLQGANYSIVIPEGTGKLQCKAIVSAATNYVASFGIEVYDTVEDAVAAHKDVEDAEFKESLYYKSGKMISDAYHVTNDDGSYTYYYNSIKQPMTYIDNETAIKTFTNYSWSTRSAFVYSSTSKNTTSAVLDSTRKSAPHHPKDASSFTIEKVDDKLIETVTDVDYSKTFNLDTITIDASTYGLENNFGFSNYASEMIIDADGNICYLAVLCKGSTYVPVPLANESGLKEWYCSPIYQNNDYSTKEGAAANTNPAFLFADDYDPTDPEKMYHFEKVIPEGGYHIVETNNFGGYTNDQSYASLDNIWKVASGVEKNLYSSQSEIEQSVSFENESLNNAKVKYQNGKVNGITFQKQLCLYVPSDAYHTYAYLKYKSGKDETKLAYATAVAEALKAQKSKITVYGNYEELEEEASGALSISYYEEHGTLKKVSLDSEPVLANYYENQATNKLAEWEKVVLG